MSSESSQQIETSVFRPVDPEPGPPTQATANPPSTRSPRSRMIVNGVLAVAFVVLVGGVSFAAGRATAPVTTGSGGGDGLVDGGFRPGLGDGGFGQFPGGPNGADDDARLGPGSAGMSIRGTVKAVAGESLTLELADGRTIEIARDSGTDYHRQAEATASDLAAGETVIVRMDGGRGVGPRPAASDITIIP